MNLDFSNVNDDPYYDLTNDPIDQVFVYENKNQEGCFISNESKSHIYKGFRLSSNPKVNVCCEPSFYRSKTTGKYIPRLVFLKIDKNFNQLEQQAKQKVRVDFTTSDVAENFWKVINFLQKFKSLVDVGEFDDSFKVVPKDAYIIEFKDKKTAEKIEDLKELFSKTAFSEAEIELILKEDRKRNIGHYKRLLQEQDSWKEYLSKYKSEIKGVGEEAVWHHFLKKHHWILGLNSDLKFIRDFVSEGDVGIKATDGKGSPKVDYIGISDFTSLVEIKTPNTKIFTDTPRKSARANTASFSTDFIDGVSQCLAQKTDWDANSSNKPIISGDEVIDPLRHLTLDSKIIFIVGNKSIEMPEDSVSNDVLVKRRTFERFRRNNRNLDIITYDELYERANHIVLGRTAE